MTAVLPNQDPLASCVPGRSTPPGVWGLRQVKPVGIKFPSCGVWGQVPGHEAQEEARRENVRSLELQGQKSLDPLSGSDADSHPGVGPTGGTAGPPLGTGQEESPGSWLGASSLQWKWYSKQKRLRRQNKALPLNKCSALKQPEPR